MSAQTPTASRQLRVGIVGAGGISNVHSNGWNNFPEKAVIAAYCDVATDRAAIQSQKYTSGKAKVYASIDELVADPDIDYFCVGPVWETPTKAGRPGVGLGLLERAAALSPPFAAGSRPWFVTGGVAPDTLDDVLATGARRVVVVRAITGAADPAAVAYELAARLREAAGPCVT